MKAKIPNLLQATKIVTSIGGRKYFITHQI